MDKGVLWVVGAGSDIARAFLRKYAAHFSRVCLATLHPDALRTFASSLGVPAELYALDLRDPESVLSFTQSAPVPDGILLCAGYLPYDNGQERRTPEDISAVCRVHAEGQILLTETILPALRRGSFLLALSSAAGERGKASNRVYCASKSAIRVYMQGLSQAMRLRGVAVHLLQLGRADTKLLRAAAPRGGHLLCKTPEAVADAMWKAICTPRSSTRTYGRLWRPVMLAIRCIPKSIYDRLEL